MPRLFIATDASNLTLSMRSIQTASDSQGTRKSSRVATRADLTGFAMTVYSGRLLIADTDSGDELFEIDPDGGDAQGTRLRGAPIGPNNFQCGHGGVQRSFADCRRLLRSRRTL